VNPELYDGAIRCARAAKCLLGARLRHPRAGDDEVMIGKGGLNLRERKNSAAGDIEADI
jgi:hypothetical protein